MLRGNLGKIILVTIICAAALYLIIPVDFMLKGEPRSLTFIPHEDPQTVEQVFSGTPAFVFDMFDSGYLDLVLQRNPEKIKAMLTKAPFRHIAQIMREVIENFDASRVYISNMMVEINEDQNKLRTLVGQHRFDEAAQLADETYAKLSQANREIKRIEEAAKNTSSRFKVPLAPPGSNLRRSYDMLMERIDTGRETLDLDKDILANFSKILGAQLLNLTEVTLKIEPMVAFVGDNIRFDGLLISEDKPLAGREVNILINSSRYTTVKTDAYGHYQGTLQIPYWYIPELDLQALYYPRDKDVGLYQTSLSPVIKLKALFHEAKLEIALEDEAYPGLETTVTGRFDYGQSPPLDERKVEIYFDNFLITEVAAPEAFTQEIIIDPEAHVGKHAITLSSAAAGRYSPVVASVTLNVTRATPILDLVTPKIAMIPGSLRLDGKLYSKVGPLSEASIKMRLGKSQVELVSSKDGTFDSKIGVGMGLSLIGSQNLVIQVLPQEPWHAPLITTSTVMMVNMVNGVVILAMIIFLGIYLPGRLRRRLGAYPIRQLEPVVPITRPQPTPAYSESTTVPASIKESAEGSGQPRSKIFYWYRFVVRLVQEITEALLKPQQTLREFAQSNSRVLGPAAQYLIELTKMVERLLYSQYTPSEKEAENSRQLYHKIKGETELRVTMQPPQPRGEGITAQLGPNVIPTFSGTRAFEFDGRILTTSPWKQLSTWLWVLLMLMIVYYACVLLFLLPLLVASLALCPPLAIVDDSSERRTKAITKEESKGESI